MKAKTFCCALVGGPFDGDRGKIQSKELPPTIWAGHCHPVSRCREIHWTLARGEGLQRGWEHYGFERTVEEAGTGDLHIYVNADVAARPRPRVEAGPLHV